MEPEVVPHDAEIIKKLLESMGVSDYDPRLVEQLMEFMYRYTAEVLQDAEAISAQSGLPAGEVGAQDVMLAIQSRSEHTFVPPPSQKLLFALAEMRNKAPLPEIRVRHGLRIPPDAECLLNPNFQAQPTEREPLVPGGAPPDGVAAESRRKGNMNVQHKHTLAVNAPGEGWKPPSDTPAEPWPGQEAGEGGGSLLEMMEEDI